VVKRFFGQGEQVSGTNYYFTRDHLGSVREVTGTSGIILARYDYDPYGRMVPVSGAFAMDFGYAGMYYHAASGLNLTLYRAYNADLGRWLSRDPSGEASGLDLYAYVAGNPVNAIDFLGLDILGALNDHAAGAYQRGGILDQAEGVLANTLEAALDTLIGAQAVKDAATKAGTLSGAHCKGSGLAEAATLGLIGLNALPGESEAANTVYRVVDEADNVIYVGVTKDLAQRILQHGDRFGDADYEIVAEGLSRTGARGVEQALIELHGFEEDGGTLLNKINSIAESNPIYNEAVSFGRQFLQSIGYE
jgi:RHS repeat-associated protein